VIMPLEVIKTPLAGLLLFKPKVFTDRRGHFYESWRLRDYQEHGVRDELIQDNCSYSVKNVLRGLHVQKGQGKMMWVTHGTVFQVTLDMRPGSKTYGKHYSLELNHVDPVQVYIEAGFASGFLVKSEFACINYKCSRYYTPSEEGGVLWNDPDLEIPWPVREPVMSERDKGFPRLRDFVGPVL
jgi:dTDP-4-dehydrorhamnose 3,5-epimerase